MHLHLALRNACLRKDQYKTLSEGEAVIFKLTGYASKKEKSEEFFSDPFYVTPGGYKMCIRVYANGAGDDKGTHVSVYQAILYCQQSAVKHTNKQTNKQTNKLEVRSVFMSCGSHLTAAKIPPT